MSFPLGNQYSKGKKYSRTPEHRAMMSKIKKEQWASGNVKRKQGKGCRVPITKDYLEEIYVNNSLYDISKQLNLTPSAILYWFKKWNIKTHTKHIGRKLLGRKLSFETRQKISKANKGKTISYEHRVKISLAETKRTEFTGFVSSEERRIRASKRMQDWRENVFKRDNYRCQKCGKIEEHLHAHHVKSFIHFPELRFDVNNGQTLCGACHMLTHSHSNKLCDCSESKQKSLINYY